MPGTLKFKRLTRDEKERLLNQYVAKRADWVLKSDKYGGTIVIFISQGSDLNIREENRGGVCWALAFHWLKAEIDDNPGFVNALGLHVRIYQDRNNGDSALIPHHYLEEQDRYGARRRTFIVEEARLDDKIFELKMKADSIKSNPKPNPTVVKETLDQVRALKESYAAIWRDLYKGCSLDLPINFFIDRKSITSFDQLADRAYEKMKEGIHSSKPTYFLFTLRKADGGHVVGFSFGTDGKAKFFDANLGLIAFTNRRRLKSFFLEEVVEYYRGKNYDQIRLLQLLSPAPASVV